MILASIIALGDGIQGSSTGILRGIGLPGLAANINLVSYWVLGLPIGAYVTWRTLDVAALWTGLAIAVSSAAILMNIFILRNDWEKRAEEALERMADSDEYTRLSDDESEDERLLA
jgi:MATE family multidrug resistance protein